MRRLLWRSEMQDININIRRILFIATLITFVCISLACGGGGVGTNATSSDPLKKERFKASFKANHLYRAMPGDSLLIYRLGDRKPILSVDALGDVTEPLKAVFDVEHNYVLTINRLGVNYLGTIITRRQILEAESSGILDMGELNPITTFLTHITDPIALHRDDSAASRIVAEVIEEYTHVDDFSQLDMASIVGSDKDLLRDTFYHEASNRINALTVFSSILARIAEDPAVQVNTLDMQNLLSAILTSNGKDWADASQAAIDNNNSLGLIESRIDFNNNLLVSRNGEFVLGPQELKTIFFDPESADDLELFDLAVNTPSSIISGVVKGPGVADTKVFLQSENSSGSFTTYEAEVGADGSFSFNGLPKNGHYSLKARSNSGAYVYRSFINVDHKVEIESFSIDDNTLELVSNVLKINEGGIGSSQLSDGSVTTNKLDDGVVSTEKLAHGAVTSDKLEAHLVLSNITVASANLGGLLFPFNDGTSGQALITDGQGNLSFATISNAYNAATDNSGSVNLLDQSIIAEHIADGAVSSIKLSDGAVTSSKIADGAIVSEKLADQLQLQALSTLSLQTTSANLGGLMMPSDDGTVGQVLITDGNGQLSFATITGGMTSLSVNSIDGSHIQADSIDHNDLKTGAVRTSHIQDGSIQTDKINDQAVTSAKLSQQLDINTLNVTDLNVHSANIEGILFPSYSDASDGHYLRYSASGGNLYFSNVVVGTNTINNAMIRNDAIETVNIAADSIITAKINDGAVTSAKINDGAVTSAKMDSMINIDTLSANNFTATAANIEGILFPSYSDASDGKYLRYNASGGNLFFSDAVAGTNTIDNSMIENDAIETVNIAANSIISTKINDGAVTSAKMDSMINIDTLSANNFTATAANIEGILFPSYSDASDGKYLRYNASGGNLFFSDAVAGTNAITNSMMADNSILNEHISNNAVKTAQIEDGAITTNKLDHNIGAVNFSVAGNAAMGNVSVSGNLVLGNSHNDLVSSSSAGGNVWFAGNLISSSNSFSLGTAQKPWQAIYAIKLVTTSDERLKKDIEPIEYGLDTVMQLRPVSYNWKDHPNDKKTLGLLAQEVEEVIEEVVSVTEDQQQARGIQYVNMVPVLIKAIQDQQTIIHHQEQKLRAQDQTIRRQYDISQQQESRLQKLEKALLPQ